MLFISTLESISGLRRYSLTRFCVLFESLKITMPVVEILFGFACRRVLGKIRFFYGCDVAKIPRLRLAEQMPISEKFITLLFM